MNWKQTLNPWRYARGLETDLELFKRAVAQESKQKKQWIADYGKIVIQRDGLMIECGERKKDIITLTSQLETANDKIAGLKAELATALDALRVAEDRADKNAVACDAAHDHRPVDIVWAEPSEIGNAIKRLRERPVNVGAIPKDRRRTKENSTEKRTATAPGGAKLVLKNVEHDNRDSEKAYADAVKESEND